MPLQVMNLIMGMSIVGWVPFWAGKMPTPNIDSVEFWFRAAQSAALNQNSSKARNPSSEAPRHFLKTNLRLNEGAFLKIASERAI